MAKKSAKSAKSAKKTAKKKSARKPNAAFMKPMTPSADPTICRTPRTSG